MWVSGSEDGLLCFWVCRDAMCVCVCVCVCFIEILLFCTFIFNEIETHSCMYLLLDGSLFCLSRHLLLNHCSFSFSFSSSGFLLLQSFDGSGCVRSLSVGGPISVLCIDKAQNLIVAGVQNNIK